MKKMILGAGLSICGRLVLLGTLAAEAIHLAPPNFLSQDLLFMLGVGTLLFIGGVTINIIGESK